jgi:hypothetical protein
MKLVIVKTNTKLLNLECEAVHSGRNLTDISEEPLISLHFLPSTSREKRPSKKLNIFYATGCYIPEKNTFRTYISERHKHSV